jgi:hypothetical protein
MSMIHPSSTSKRPLGMALLLAGYIAAYLFASAADLGTTVLAVHTGVPEGNVFATSGGVYDSAKAWFVTVAGGGALSWYFWFGLHHADRVSDHWLRHPVRSFFCFYLRPWSAKVIDRSPLHTVAFALAMLPLRVMAAANNLVIAAGGTGPLGWMVGRVARATTPALGLVLTIGPLYVMLAMMLLGAAARLIAICSNRG